MQRTLEKAAMSGGGAAGADDAAALGTWGADFTFLLTWVDSDMHTKPGAMLPMFTDEKPPVPPCLPPAPDFAAAPVRLLRSKKLSMFSELGSAKRLSRSLNGSLPSSSSKRL